MILIARWTWVVLLALLQALGPFLHAHAQAATRDEGLHLHLLATGTPAAARAATAAERLTDQAHPAEGAAIFLTTEYRRDGESPVVVRADGGLVALASCLIPVHDPQDVTRAGLVLPERSLRGLCRSLRPPATAPPLA